MAKKDWSSLAAKIEKQEKPKIFNVYPDCEARLRVIGDMPWEFQQHWFSEKGKLYRCAGSDCVACRNGHKAVYRFLLPVMMRNKGEEPYCAVWSFPKTVFAQLKNLRFDPDFGDLRDYDIRIRKGKQPISRIEVSATANNKPLPVEEKEMAVKFLKETDIDSLAKPVTNEDILRNMGQKAIFKNK